MDREAMAAYLARAYRDVLGFTDIAPTDTPDGFGFVLDAVGALYVAQPSLPLTYADPLAEYYLLVQLENEFMGIPKITVDGDTYDLSTVLTNIQRKLSALRGRIGWIVEPVEETESEVGKVVTIHSPFLSDSHGYGGEF